MKRTWKDVLRLTFKWSVIIGVSIFAFSIWGAPLLRLIKREPWIALSVLTAVFLAAAFLNTLTAMILKGGRAVAQKSQQWRQFAEHKMLSCIPPLKQRWAQLRPARKEWSAMHVEQPQQSLPPAALQSPPARSAMPGFGSAAAVRQLAAKRRRAPINIGLLRRRALQRTCVYGMAFVLETVLLFPVVEGLFGTLLGAWPKVALGATLCGSLLLTTVLAWCGSTFRRTVEELDVLMASAQKGAPLLSGRISQLQVQKILALMIPSLIMGLEVYGWLYRLDTIKLAIMINTPPEFVTRLIEAIHHYRPWAMGFSVVLLAFLVLAEGWVEHAWDELSAAKQKVWQENARERQALKSLQPLKPRRFTFGRLLENGLRASGRGIARAMRFAWNLLCYLAAQILFILALIWFLGKMGFFSIPLAVFAVLVVIFWVIGATQWLRSIAAKALQIVLYLPRQVLESLAPRFPWIAKMLKKDGELASDEENRGDTAKKENHNDQA